MENALNNLAESEIYIDNTLCENIPLNFDPGKWLTFVCNSDEPLKGNSVKVLNPHSTGVVMCGIEIYG